LGAKSDQAVIAERLLSISGEDTLTVDRKYADCWTGRLPTRFMLLMNELPRIADNSGALAGRFIILALTRSFFGKEDLELAGRLRAERAGIVNWALVGYRRLQERGHFIQPSSASEAVEELQALGAPIKAFVRESCKVAPGATVAVVRLYQAWRTWCEDNGRDRPGDKQSFGRGLRAAVPGLCLVRRKEGDDRTRHYDGITLQTGG
jgi:putative DNA primase/helicase